MRFLTGSLAVAGLALSAVGCGGGSSHACKPDLTVHWAIVDSGSNTPASCSDVGATNLRVTIDGQSMDFPCPAAQNSGSIPAPLEVSGPHTVAVSLLNGTAPFGQDVSISIDVDCSGLTETPDLTVAAPTGCTPDLTISWDIVRAVDGVSSLTCAQAGNSDTVNAQISGGGLSVPMNFPAVCPTNATTGSFVALLPAAGTYSVTVQLLAGTQVISQTDSLTQVVDCSGQSATPFADLNANF